MTQRSNTLIVTELSRNLRNLTIDDEQKVLRSCLLIVVLDSRDGNSPIIRDESTDHENDKKSNNSRRR